MTYALRSRHPLVDLRLLNFALADAGTSQWLVMAALVVRGFGLGAVTLPLFATAYLGLDRGQIADASVISRAAQQVGGSFGSAILAVVLADRFTRFGPDHTGAYHATFWWTVSFTLAAVLLALRLPTRKPGPTPPSADRLLLGAARPRGVGAGSHPGTTGCRASPRSDCVRRTGQRLCSTGWTIQLAGRHPPGRGGWGGGVRR